MVSRLVNLITGLIGLVMVCVLTIGLAHSISSGFAGFWGGLPFAIITVAVLAMVAYDFWDQCIRRKPD